MSAPQTKPDLTPHPPSQRPADSGPADFQKGGESVGLKFARSIGSWLFGVGYALWLGGLIALGAFMAPNVAATLHNPTVVSGGEPLRRAILNGIVGNSFRLFDTASLCSYFVMALGSYLESYRQPATYRPWIVMRSWPLFFAAIDAGRLYFLIKQMDQAQIVGNMTLFNSLHHQYEATAMLQLPLLLLVGALTAGREWFARNGRTQQSS